MSQVHTFATLLWEIACGIIITQDFVKTLSIGTRAQRWKHTHTHTHTEWCFYKPTFLIQERKSVKDILQMEYSKSVQVVWVIANLIAASQN